MTVDMNKLNKSTCIIVDKIFAQCRTKACINNVNIPFKIQELKEIKFQQGCIVVDTLEVHNIENRPNFKRIIFKARIPFEAITYNGKIYNVFLPDIEQNIILFMPDFNRSEFKFDVQIETMSEVLGDVIESDNKIHFTSGTTLIISVVGKVQLLIPYFGFCQESSICVDFEFEEHICEKFYDEPFPDFYPPQLQPCRKKCIRKDIKIRRVNDVIIYGQIKKCITDEPIAGATIKAFYNDNKGNLIDICHTFSGCNGYYMLRLPQVYQGEVITIMASKDNCLNLSAPCECEEQRYIKN